MGILWFIQARQTGEDPPRNAPLPSWLRIALILQGTLMFLWGGAMFIFPETMIPLWAWKLSPLTSQAIGAWGAGIGVIALHASWENDWSRLFPMMLSYTIYGILQIISLIRYPEFLDWSHFSAIDYTIFIVSIFLIGGYGTLVAWRKKDSLV